MVGMTKTIAERLREKPNGASLECFVATKMMGLTCGDTDTCMACFDLTADKLADAIEAEQSELRELMEFNHDTFMRERDFLCERIEELKKSQLPEGIQWPRFEDGELVKFGDKVGKGDAYMESPVDVIAFFADGDFELFGCGNSIAFCKGVPVKRPEPEVLDADGVPIKVGDTVYAPGYFDEPFQIPFSVDHINVVDNTALVYAEGRGACGFRGDQLTHRKPDSQEAIDDDATMPPHTYCYKVLNIP